MSEPLDAHKVADHLVTALNSPDHDASDVMLQEVNADLRKLSEPERDLVANDLSLKGVLPDIAIISGLVGEDTFVTKESLAKLAAEQGTTTVQGMSAKFLSDNFQALGGGVRQDVNADYVSGFDQRYDLALETAGAKREFGGLLTALKAQNLDNADIQSRDGLQAGDIDALLAKPDQLTADQTSALKTMKDHFEYMKTPRGIWTVTDWTTPRVTETSLDEFVDTGVPLGMRDQLKIAESEKLKQANLETAAQQAQLERQAPPVVTTEDATKTDSPEIKPETPVEGPKSEIPAEVPTTDIQVEEPKVDKPTEAPGATPSDVPKTETPTEVPKSETPTEVPKTETPTEVPKSETPTEVPKSENPTEVPKSETPTEVPKSETPTEVPKSETPTEVPKSETPTDVPTSETPTEVPGKPDAPLAPPEKPGEQPTDQTTPPESMEKDKVADKEIEVVKGDSLWKIARAHLTETGGKRPSNEEVAKLVSQIVEKNNIKTPDLIYPGQKFIIPGEAAPEAPGTVNPDTTTPDTKPPEKMPTDSTTPTTVPPETVTPENVTPQSVTPESLTPESTTPRTTTPETVTPESTTPETVTPDTATPETTTPAGTEK